MKNLSNALVPLIFYIRDRIWYFLIYKCYGDSIEARECSGQGQRIKLFVLALFAERKEHQLESMMEEF